MARFTDSIADSCRVIRNIALFTDGKLNMKKEITDYE